MFTLFFEVVEPPLLVAELTVDYPAPGDSAWVALDVQGGTEPTTSCGLPGYGMTAGLRRRVLWDGSKTRRDARPLGCPTSQRTRWLGSILKSIPTDSIRWEADWNGVARWMA